MARAASLAAMVLLALFTTVYLVVRPADICGCWFTLTLSPGGYFHILQNVIFIGLAALTWVDSANVSYFSPVGRHSTAAHQSDDLGFAYYFARDYPKAIEQFKKALDMDANLLLQCSDASLKRAICASLAESPFFNVNVVIQRVLGLSKLLSPIAETTKQVTS